MKYILSKHGIISTILETLDSKAITNLNIIVDTNISNLRKRVGNFILDRMKKMTSGNGMVGWKTSVGQFWIYKEDDFDIKFDHHKCKYGYCETIMEFTPVKGEQKYIILKRKRFVNPEYEGLEDCQNCNAENVLVDYTVIRQGKEVKVCKKCKDFDTILNKLDKNQELTKSEIRSLTH